MKRLQQPDSFAGETLRRFVGIVDAAMALDEAYNTAIVAFARAPARTAPHQANHAFCLAFVRLFQGVQQRQGNLIFTKVIAHEKSNMHVKRGINDDIVDIIPKEIQ